MKRPVTVQIAGHRYTLRSDAEEQDVLALAAFVDGLWKDVQRQSRAADTQAVAVLTALRIAEELFGERQATAALKRRIREQGETLLDLLSREAGV